ncbi:uncharacterized protein [Penaeus vannamei]|uniref:Neurogenic differentiation factor 1 n=1 Tax=Penaeus vannamei TaxID=6689 RepID=A0A3R7PYL1_PENVA|nr:uncharacterized protein LOC113823302 [Penaeus vannamei]ROT63558.1 Neurogenic differentiation factor 1 [Penaeus vannamei]
MNADAVNGGKYALRTKSIIKRIESEKNRATSKRKEPKEKQKPPPLSKYRRKTANARERNRMKEINDAFVTLQKAIPDLPGADAEKLTKITILRLAVNYIDALAGVLDDDYNPTDIDGVRELWCLENAHMARPEHCVRPVMKSPGAKTSAASSGKNSKTISNSKNNSKVSKPKSQQSHARTDGSKSKHTIATKSTTKRPSKPKNKPRECKTASIATSNGAYITLKNVALQTPPHRVGRTINNEPLMMSMTVKRPRVDSITTRPHKLPRLEPVVPLMTLNQPLLAFTPCGANLSHVPAAIPGNDTPEPLAGATPTTLHHVTYTDPATIFHTGESVSVNVAFQDLDSPVVRNDVLLEFPRSGRHLSESSSRDSAFSSDGSSPPSPLDTVAFPAPVPVPVPIGDSSPSFSIASSSGISGCGSSSDCESVLAAPVELGSLLGDEPFEEELDHLTSTFAEGDDTLNLFLAHSSSNFICTDIDDC